jgi:hypothetical protein
MEFLFLLLYLLVIYLRPAEWVVVFRGWQLVDVTLMGAALFLFFRIVLARRRFVALPHNGMLLGLWAAAILSHLVHTYIGGAVGAFTLFARIAITYFLIVNTVTSQGRFRIALALIVVLTAVLVWQGIEQHQTGLGWAGQRMSSGRRITWISIFNDPNDLALAFVIMVPVVLAYLVRPTFFGLKVVPLSLLAVLVYGIFLTNSRGGMLGLMVAVMYFFVRRSRWVVPGMVIGGLFAGLLFVFGPSRLGLLTAEGAAIEESAYGRLDSWYYGFQLMKSNPLFGVGHDMFTDQYPLTAHNSFVLAASEMGVLGLFFWVGFFYVAFKGLSLVQRHHPRLSAYACGLQASLVGFAATAFFLSRTYIEIPYLVAAFAAALFAIAREDTDRVAFAFGWRDVRNVGLLCMASLGMAQLAMKTWL